MCNLAYKHVQIENATNRKVVEEDIQDTLQGNCSFVIIRGSPGPIGIRFPLGKIRNIIYITVFFEPRGLNEGDTFAVTPSINGCPVNMEKFTYKNGMHYVSMPVLDGYSGLYAGSEWTIYTTFNVECGGIDISSIICTGNTRKDVFISGGTTICPYGNGPAMDNKEAQICIPFLQKIVHPQQNNSIRKIAPGLLYNFMIYSGYECVMRFVT
jgi:hypothetical protein